MAEGIESQALEYAAQLLGGHAALAERLGISMDCLGEWIAETRYLPDEKLLEVLDVILTALAGRKDAA